MKPVLIIAMSFFCFSAHAQEATTPHKKEQKVAKGSGKITGIIKNMPEQTVVLELLRANDVITIIDSAHTDANGHFELPVNGTEPELYRLHFSANKFIFLSLNKESVKVTSDWNDLDNYSTSGSKGSEELEKFIVAFRKDMISINKMTMFADSLKKNGKDSLMSMAGRDIEKKQLEVTKLKKETATKSTNEPTAILAARLLNPNTDGAFLADFSKNLSKRFPGTVMTRDFNEFYEKVTKAGQEPKVPQVGDMAPEVALTTPDGATVTLSSYKGHYVLLDFWASWCGPCRGENPNVVAAYNKYKDRNFTILGVSLDNNKDAWQKAITTDGLAWSQVSELKGWSSSVAATYGIRSIPQNFLIDPTGKIVAHNLRGSELETTLESTLKAGN